MTACPGHHRGAGPSRGFQWTTANRQACREYLDDRAEDRARRAFLRPINPDPVTSMAKDKRR